MPYMEFSDLMCPECGSNGPFLIGFLREKISCVEDWGLWKNDFDRSSLCCCTRCSKQDTIEEFLGEKDYIVVVVEDEHEKEIGERIYGPTSKELCAAFTEGATYVNDSSLVLGTQRKTNG